MGGAGQQRLKKWGEKCGTGLSGEVGQREGKQVDDKVGGEDSWMEMIKIEPEGKGKLKAVPLTQTGLG